MMLNQVVTNQVGQQREARQEEADTSTVREFLRINTPSFTGSSTAEDLENFIEELKKEGRAAMLIGDMDVSRLMVYMYQKGPAPSSASAPAKNKSEYYGQNSRVKPTYSEGSVAQGGSKPPACAKCSRNHSDLGVSLSFVTPYVAMSFDVIPEQLSEPFIISTPVDMVDFDVIFGMDWLYACYASVDCRTRVVKFQFSNEPVLEWKEV
ncbi:hypothetical protein H5410_033403 [Solanum commersonii]|uniref:Gag-pol polyprotein n=1 Tax=Solanum commersonii TaxID=4109 RepID=A0A9J5YNL8_SOLCO|nr:hypothetical protein H5410_033403 [Solanum commersonii]